MAGIACHESSSSLKTQIPHWNAPIRTVRICARQRTSWLFRAYLQVNFFKSLCMDGFRIASAICFSDFFLSLFFSIIFIAGFEMPMRKWSVSWWRRSGDNYIFSLPKWLAEECPAGTFRTICANSVHNEAWWLAWFVRLFAYRQSIPVASATLPLFTFCRLRSALFSKGFSMCELPNDGMYIARLILCCNPQLSYKAQKLFTTSGCAQH